MIFSIYGTFPLYLAKVQSILCWDHGTRSVRQSSYQCSSLFQQVLAFEELTMDVGEVGTWSMDSEKFEGDRRERIGVRPCAPARSEGSFGVWARSCTVA